MNNYRQMHLIPPTLYSQLMKTIPDSGNTDGSKCLNINQLNSIQNEDGGKVFISQKPETQNSHTHLPMVNDIKSDQTTNENEIANSGGNDGGNANSSNEESMVLDKTPDFNVSKQKFDEHGYDVTSAIINPKEDTQNDSKMSNNTTFILDPKMKAYKSKSYKDLLSWDTTNQPNRFSSTLPAGIGFSQVNPKNTTTNNNNNTQDLSLRLDETNNIDIPENASAQQTTLNTSLNSNYGQLKENANISTRSPMSDSEDEFIPPRSSTPTPSNVNNRSKEDIVTVNRQHNEETAIKYPPKKPSMKVLKQARQTLTNKYRGVIPSEILSRKSKRKLKSAKPVQKVKVQYVEMNPNIKDGSDENNDEEEDQLDDSDGDISDTDNNVTAVPNVTSVENIQKLPKRKPIPTVKQRKLTKRTADYEYRVAIKTKKFKKFSNKRKADPDFRPPVKPKKAKAPTYVMFK